MLGTIRLAPELLPSILQELDHICFRQGFLESAEREFPPRRWRKHHSRGTTEQRDERASPHGLPSVRGSQLTTVHRNCVVHHSKFWPPMTGSGQTRPSRRCPLHDRCSTESGSPSVILLCPKCANSTLIPCSH